MMDAGLVIHRFSTADNATPMIRRLAGQISEARLYMLEDALPYWLAWYETMVPVPETGTEEWTPDADDLEAMSFNLRRDLSNPDDVSSEIQWLYVVHTDVPDSVAVEYNAWYDEEHLPRLVRVPGIVRARRYESAQAHPRYLTAYDLSDRNAFTSPEGLKARKTQWTERMRGLFSNTRRFTGRLRSPAGGAEGP